MNPVLTELVRSGTVVSESGKIHRIHSHIPTEEGLFLKALISESKPRVSLEVGLAYGISALFICEALSVLPQARHIVIDPHQVRPGKTHISFEGVGLENLKRAGYRSMIEFLDEPSHLALPKLVSQGVRIDFALIDGWHTFDFASVDFFYIDMLLRPGGIVAIDDTDFPSLWKLCRYITSNRAYRVLRCLPAPDVPTRFSARTLMVRLRRSVSRVSYGLTHRDGLLPFSRCIAFRKEADDSRSWDFHRGF